MESICLVAFAFNITQFECSGEKVDIYFFITKYITESRFVYSLLSSLRNRNLPLDGTVVIPLSS